MYPSILQLPVRMLPQPDETTCGPTCLYSLYTYWGEDAPLSDVIDRTHKLERGGTFAIFLAYDALRHGYQATIYTYNLTVFDPTWFAPGVDIAERLLKWLANHSGASQVFKLGQAIRLDQPRPSLKCALSIP